MKNKRTRSLHIVHLYPKEMNIYGDTGNLQILSQRLKWRYIHPVVTFVGIDQPLPPNPDIILGGGGQDAGQSLVQNDLAKKALSLKRLAADGVIMLMICGLYQLFGRRFVTHTGEEIKGIGLLPLETIAGQKRHIGNTAYDTPYGEVIGFENHSGLTYLDHTTDALGKVRKGSGNNGKDGTEGCVQANVFGSYSHGPILSKNPHFADEILSRAYERKYGQKDLMPLDDELELKAASIARNRPY